MINLIENDKEYIWHPFTPLSGDVSPVLIKAAEGLYLITEDGRRIMDAVSSWWVNLHGHANEYIARAIADQALTLEHVIFAGFTHQPAIQLALNLISILPANQKKIFYSDNGSTAVEVALKMAIQYWNNKGISKTKIIALDGSYHGDTFGAMSVGERGMFTDPFKPYLFEVDFIDFPTPGNQSEIINRFASLVKSGDVAAFIFEPLVQGAGGMRMYSPEMLDRLIELARQHKVICIADEVFSGFGRTGKMFACNYLENKPDIMAISKGITGGTLPLGVTSCSQEIVSAFETPEFHKTFFHGHSYTANPLACAAANASFDLLMNDSCQNQIKMISDMHATFVNKLSKHSNVKDARSLGTILAVEIISENRTSYTNDIRKKIYPYFLERNILLRPLGNTLYVVPPYIITGSELISIYVAIEEFLATVK